MSFAFTGPANIVAGVNTVHDRARVTKATEGFRSTHPIDLLEGPMDPQQVFLILNDPSVEVSLEDLQRSAEQGNETGRFITEMVHQRAAALAEERGEDLSDAHKSEAWAAWTEEDTAQAQEALATRHKHALAKSTGDSPFAVVAASEEADIPEPNQ